MINNKFVVMCAIVMKQNVQEEAAMSSRLHDSVRHMRQFEVCVELAEHGRERFVDGVIASNKHGAVLTL